MKDVRRHTKTPVFVKGAVAQSSHVIEAFRYQHDKRNDNLILAGESLQHSNIDVGWLPAASETYAISADPRDYVLVDIPIVTVDIPNRNLQAFPYEEVSYFDPLYGRMVYQSFERKPCLVGDTLVVTDKGMLPLEQLSREQAAWVATRTGKARIKKWWLSGHKPVATMTTVSGTTLTGTLDHPVLVLTPGLFLKWTNLGDLQVGDHVVVRNRGGLVETDCDLRFATDVVARLHDETYDHASVFGKRTASIRRRPEYRRTPLFPDRMTNELARILGYLVSQFINTDAQLIDDYRACWRACFGQDLPAYQKNAPSGRSAWVVSTGKADVAAWLSAIGLPASVAQTKRVPFTIFKSSRSAVLHFLAAYIEGRGCMKHRLQVASTSRKLLQDIKLLLESFWDVRPSVSLQRAANGQWSDVWCLRLTARESRQLAPELPFVSQHRLDQLSTITSKQVRDRGIPYVRDYALAKVKQHAVGRGKSRKYYDQDGVPVAGPIQILAGTTDTHTQAKKWCREHVIDVANQLEKLNAEYGQRLRELVGDFYFDKVADVSSPSTLHYPVYDIETTASQFAANNIIVHNCHQDHDNKDPLKAKGVMFDSALQYVPQYGVWKIRILSGWDRTKDSYLVNQILRKKRTGYSMGALVENFVPLPAMTKVLTEHGWVAIESVKPGTRVMTVHGLAPSGGAVFNDYLPTISLDTDVGLDISAAPSHPVLVLTPSLQTEWREAGDIAVGDYVAVAAKPATFPDDLPLDYVPIVDDVNQHGMSLCAICHDPFRHLDRHIRSTHNMSVGQYVERFGRPTAASPKARTDITYPTRMTDNLAALLGYFVAEWAWVEEAPNTTMLGEHYASCLRDTFGLEPAETVDVPLGIRDFYRYLGVEHGYGTERHVPWSIFRAPKSAVAAFLRAFWERDGSARAVGGAVTYHTSSKQLAQDIQLLLLMFGIPSQRLTRHDSRWQRNCLYDIAVYGKHIDTFIKEIGATSSERRHDLENLRVRRRMYTQYGESIPYAMAVLNQLFYRCSRGECGYYETPSGETKRLSLHRLELKNSSELAYGHFERYPDLLGNIKEIEPELGERFAGLLESRLVWTRVTDKRLSHVLQPCYCIRDVEAGHNFIAEGYIVHNCSVCGAIDTNLRKCNCMRRGKGAVIDGKLVYQACCGVNFIENSSVEDPADITADTEAIFD